MGVIEDARRYRAGNIVRLENRLVSCRVRGQSFVIAVALI